MHKKLNKIGSPAQKTAIDHRLWTIDHTKQLSIVSPLKIITLKHTIHIIGGGIIGLCAAYYLQKASYEVTVIDKGDFSDSCSHGNAGMIVPSHFIPMAAPGVIAKGIRWMFDSKSPFYIKPRLNTELLRWLWTFYRSCKADKVEESIPVLRDYNWLSLAEHEKLAQELGVYFEKKGLLMLYRTAKGGKEEGEVAEQANEIGVTAKHLNTQELEALTGTAVSALGGYWYRGDAHLHPNALMNALRQSLKASGAKFIGKTAVTGFETSGNKVTHIHTTAEKMAVENLVLAGGSFSAKLAASLGIKLLIQDGKGYSFTLQNDSESTAIPTIFVEDKATLTPMGTLTRIAGTLEISGHNSTINTSRLQGIVEAVPRYYPNIQPEIPDTQSVWYGYRPCSPDGLPYMGKSAKFNNLTIATGHAMMGLSLGPASGKLVAEIVQGLKPSLNLSLMAVERF